MQYKHHCISNTLALLACHAGLYYIQVGLQEQGLFAGSFLFATFLMSPDLDLQQSTPTQNWGLLKVLWKPYNKRSKHRGLSHFPVVGTFSRLLYLSLLIGLIILVYDLSSANLNNDLSDFILLEGKKIMDGFKVMLAKKNLVGFALLGLIVADIIHLFCDLCYSLVRS